MNHPTNYNILWTSGHATYCRATSSTCKRSLLTSQNHLLFVLFRVHVLELFLPRGIFFPLTYKGKAVSWFGFQAFFPNTRTIPLYYFIILVIIRSSLISSLYLWSIILYLAMLCGNGFCRFHPPHLLFFNSQHSGSYKL